LQQQASYSQEVQRLKAASNPVIKPVEAGKKQFTTTASITKIPPVETTKASIAGLLHSPSQKPAQKTVNKSNRPPAKKNTRTRDVTPTAPVQVPAPIQLSARTQVPALTQASAPKPRAILDSDTRQPRLEVSTNSMPRLGNKLAAAPKKYHTSPPKTRKAMGNPRGTSGNPKLTSATASDCRDYKTVKGCLRKNCRWFHRDVTSKDVPIMIQHRQEVEKLIDIDEEPSTTVIQTKSDVVPIITQHPKEVEKLIDIDEEPSTTVLQTKSDNVPTKNTKPIKSKKKKRGKKAVDTMYKPEVKEIQWKNNPQLADPSFAMNSLWAIFGTDRPSIKQIETWCSEMGSQGNFKYFSKYALQNWFEVLGLNDTQRAMLIILPYVPEKINPSCRGYVMRIKNEYEREQAKPKYNTFYKFAELPNEICVKIWQFTHRFGRTVKVSFNLRFDPRDHERHPLFTRLTPPSPLWQTSVQSRASAMLDRRCCYRYSDYFSYDLDTLFIADSAARLNQYSGWIDDSDRKTLRHLQFHYYNVRDCKNLETWANDVAIFRNLKTLDIVISDAKEEHKYYVRAQEMLPLVERTINKAYKYYGNKPPKVKVLALGSEKAKELGIEYSFW
jgi:hypothetical protein